MDDISQPSLFNQSSESSGSVECLGMTFENDEARRAYFLEKLREKLKDPEFRKIEGFPIGEDEDILALSDPPYYTACPNPFINDFTRLYGKPYLSEEDAYHREPFAADVSEGKGDQSYYIHTYHTKVPPAAIARFVEHYTESNDLVLDCFSGSGMTGLGVSLAKQNSCKALLIYLSPAASFISYFHNIFRPNQREIQLLEEIITNLKHDYGEWYKTQHNGWLASGTAPKDWRKQSNFSSNAYGTIEYVVWSDACTCPECNYSSSLWDFCVDLPNNQSLDIFPCPSCSALLTKEKKFAKKNNSSMVERVYESLHDSALNQVVQRIKRLPVLISYEYNKRRYEKPLDLLDIEIINQVNLIPIKDWHPNYRMPEGDESRRNDEIGLTHVHHFFQSKLYMF